MPNTIKKSRKKQAGKQWMKLWIGQASEKNKMKIEFLRGSYQGEDDNQE